MRHMPRAFCNPVCVRKATFVILALGLTAAVVVGAMQAKDGEQATGGGSGHALSLSQVSEPIEGAPPQLAALRERVNVLDPGGPKAFDAELRALRGHPVVVNLWASWCDPCRYELPFFQREALRRGDKVAFLGVNVGDERGAAGQMAAEFPMPYPSFEDPRSRLVARYRSRGLPATAFYDASGKLVLVHQGVFSTQAKLAEAIDRYTVSS